MTKQIVVDQEEIDAVLNRCADAADEGGSDYMGMTYEDGVAAGIKWLTDADSGHPFD